MPPEDDSFPEKLETIEETRALITLSLVPRIGSSRIRSLVSWFGSAIAVLNASRKELAKVEGIGDQTIDAICRFSEEHLVDWQVECAQRIGATLVTYWSSQYPALLKNIFDPPAFLWAIGDTSLLAHTFLAVVGTRNPTEYGKQVAREFTLQLVHHNIGIVSGLAYGVDAVAHRAALESGGTTIAVLGSGVDRIYPAPHRQLADAIKKEGIILSEFPLQSKPDASNFPRRNRIISGLSLGTLVVESFEKGGALITARLALEQNRDVFAVPGVIFNESSRGNHHLIQRGHAKLVHTIEDILEELNVGSVSSKAVPESKTPELPLNPIEAKLYNVVTNTPIHIDHICERAGVDVSTALVYLLSLEFKGLVYQMAGKQFYRT